MVQPVGQCGGSLLCHVVAAHSLFHRKSTSRSNLKDNGQRRQHSRRHIILFRLLVLRWLIYGVGASPYYRPRTVLPLAMLICVNVRYSFIFCTIRIITTLTFRCKDNGEHYRYTSVLGCIARWAYSLHSILPLLSSIRLMELSTSHQ